MKRSLTLVTRMTLLIGVLFILVGATLVPATAQAQDKSATLARRDVDCTVQTSGDVQISETWELPLLWRAIHGRVSWRELKVRQFRRHFQVSEAGQDYQSGTTQAPGTFMVYQDKGLQVVKWFYTPASDTTRTFNVRYTLHGVL